MEEAFAAGVARCVAGGWAGTVRAGAPGELGGRAVGEVCPNSTSVNSNVPPTVRTLFFTDLVLVHSLYKDAVVHRNHIVMID